MSKVYTSKVLEICPNGDAILELPEELCNEMNWNVGDILDIDTIDGVVVMKKIQRDTIKDYINGLIDKEKWDDIITLAQQLKNAAENNSVSK
jgi:hypothetical protein